MNDYDKITFFTFCTGTRQIGHLSTRVAQCKQAQMCPQGENVADPRGQGLNILGDEAVLFKVSIVFLFCR